MAYVPHLATLSSEKTEQDLMDALLVPQLDKKEGFGMLRRWKKSIAFS